jgi:serine O-acetyltransferase
MINAYYFYRLARWFYLKRIPLIPKLIRLLMFLVYNSVIPYQSVIGENCRFAYGGIGVVIHKKAKIGKNVIIGTGVLIGGRSNTDGAPIIGNNVYIATGAKVLGEIEIHDNVIIGANAVVIHSVNSNCSVGGVPARVLKENIDVTQFCSLKNLA